MMYGFTIGELIGGTTRDRFEFGDETGASYLTQLTAPITPTTAVVRCAWSGRVGADYTDFHTLLKQDGTWKVIAKTYHQYDA